MTYISIPAPTLDGEYVEAITAKLSDPTGTYGVRRVSDSEIVVPDGVDLLFENGDKYSYEFDGEESTAYEAWFELYFDGEYNYIQVFIDGSDVSENTDTLWFFAVDQGEVVDFGEDVPQLASPSGLYAVKRTDTQAKILNSGVHMIESATGDGLYFKSFSRPTTDNPDSLRYKFYVKITLDGVDYYIPSSQAQVYSVMFARGRYTNSYEVGQRFGHDNMHMWLAGPHDMNEEPVDYARRAYDFIDRAEELIDASIKGPFVSGPYTTVDSATIPKLLTRLATDYAGLLMYEARGVDDVNPDTNEPIHRLRGVRGDITKLMKSIQMGRVRLSGSASLSPNSAPFAGGSCIKDAYVEATSSDSETE